MVLRDLEDAPAFDDSPPPDSTSSSPTASITIDINTLPQPFPVLGPLLGYTRSATARKVHNSLANMGAVLQRAPRQDEAEAMAYQMAALNRTASTGAALGLLFGLWRWRASSAAFGFPFYTPDAQRFDPGRFLVLRGQLARSCWHGVRLGFYGGLGMALGGAVAHTWGVVRAMAGFATDPRLKEFTQGLARIRGERMPGGTPPGKPREDAGGDVPRDQDFASSDTPALSDSQMQAKEFEQRPDARWAPTQDVENTFRMEKAAPTQPGGFAGVYADDDDDASPTARPPRLPPSAPQQQESAWERLRRQAASGNSPTASSSSSPSPYGSRTARSGTSAASPASTGDSFSFSDAEEERQLARAEAQKDFDRRIERERRGMDFEERTGSGARRW